MQGKDFWNNRQRGVEVSQKLTRLKKLVGEWESLSGEVNDLIELAELTSGDKKGMEDELLPEIEELIKKVDAFELSRMFTGDDDARDAIVAIHPGAGGTESQDWAGMLLRMYSRWAQEHKYECSLLDIQSGEEAGIKSATLEVKGENAYGYLKAEMGVHRLVRISPFDANSRRHTSFASVFIYPEVDSEIVIEIEEKDLKIDTFRASGAGGQHVNKTDSAVRITHIPTGIVAQSQSERSQHRNRENALKILRARLYQHRKDQEQEQKDQIQKEKKDISWGNQIRSYVFHPYSLVKDHRTGVEIGDIHKVMEGELDVFLDAYLRKFTLNQTEDS